MIGLTAFPKTKLLYKEKSKNEKNTDNVVSWKSPNLCLEYLLIWNNLIWVCFNIYDKYNNSVSIKEKPEKWTEKIT